MASRKRNVVYDELDDLNAEAFKKQLTVSMLKHGIPVGFDALVKGKLRRPPKSRADYSGQQRQLYGLERWLDKKALHDHIVAVRGEPFCPPWLNPDD
jgi:hypothetical protein